MLIRMKITRNIFLFLCAAALALSCDKGGSTPDTPTGPVNLKIMSFNLRSNTASGDTGDKAWSRRKTAIQAMMNEIRPDVVGMQEATTSMRTDLTNLLPDYTLKEVPGTGTSKGGNTVIMYRTAEFDLLQCKSYYLSKTPNVPSANGWNDETQYRTTIWVQLKHKETKHVFFVADTHMPLNTGGALKGKTARDNSAALNVQQMKAAAGENVPVIILGDMNCSSDETGLANYKPWLSNSRETALQKDPTDIKSYNAFGGTGQSNLDHIFYRKAVASRFQTVNKAYDGITYVSDHYPVVMYATILK